MSEKREHFKNYYKQFVANGMGLEQLRERLEFMRKDSAAFKSTTPQAAHIRADSRIFIQLTECEIKRLETLKKPTVQIPIASGAAQTKEEMACKVEFDRLTAQKNQYEQVLDKGEVVRLSELTMWFINEGTALIDRVCPQSASYRKERDAVRSKYKEVQRVCDAHASSPPCVPRLPGKEPAPAPQAAAPLKPLQNKPPAGCESGGAQGGANFKHCLAVACEKQQHKFEDSGGGCFTCDRGGSDQWTRCTSGFGSAR